MAFGHWYDDLGNPVYTIIGNNGKERPTTLRDAKKYGLGPGTTTVIQVAARQFLATWKEEQLLDAAWVWPYIPGECVKTWKQQVRVASRQQTDEAIRRGHEVHNMLEQYFKGDDTNKHHPICKAVHKELKERYGDVKWIAEASFYHPLGAGGKCDLHTKDGNGVVVDFKTKDSDDISKMVCYDDHKMQLASYREGLIIPKAQGINVFVSTCAPGLVKVVEHSEEELQTGWQMFCALLKFWQLKSKYEVK